MSVPPHLLHALQALQGQTITPELLQSLMKAVPPPPPPPPPQDEIEGDSVDDLLVAQQVAEHDNRILAAMAAPRLGNSAPPLLDPLADEEFSDSEDEISEQRAGLDALLAKHNLETVPDDDVVSDHSEELVDPEIFANVPAALPAGESEISAGFVDSVIENGKLIVVSGGPPLDVGTSLALNDRSIVAVVVDTFGSVTAPLLLAVVRENCAAPALAQPLFTTPSLAREILLDEANGVFAIRGGRLDEAALEDASDDEDDDHHPEISQFIPPPPPAAAPRAPSGFSWK
jgi:hypothetical protein